LPARGWPINAGPPLGGAGGGFNKATTFNDNRQGRRDIAMSPSSTTSPLLQLFAEPKVSRFSYHKIL
jgi:hypothetical protein